MIIDKIYLVTRNARDKVQVVLAELEQIGNNFIIRRITGQYQGKMTAQPELLIERGKAKRSVLQQAMLEFNSIVSKYMDKGYKKISDLTSKKFEDLTEEELCNLVPTLKSDSNGNLKPMLAKDFNKCQNSIFEKELLCSRKLNGVRCMMKWDGEKVVTISRGGKTYDCAAQHLTKQVHNYLKNNPSTILDGELYRHGHYLQELSGIARKETWEDKCKVLQYWIYDIADAEREFKDRLVELKNIQNFFSDYEDIQVLDHYKTECWDQVKRLHDKWVSEGYEGLVARKPNKPYEFGKRGSTMIKVKAYQDGEFTIIDYRDGLRDEDFCFICETDSGQAFAAKPIGSREIKADYIKNINDIIGLKGTVKYFEISKDGIPMQPIFQAVRYEEDI